MDSGPIYQLHPADVCRALESSLQGLTTSEAESRRALLGLNLLTEEQSTPQWQSFIKNASHPMALMLLGAGTIALFLGQFSLGLSIFVLVIINAGFSFLRSHRAGQAMDALRRLLPEYTRLLRDNVEVSLPSSEIVPGDVLVLAEGDNIPADARVVEEYGLRTNNATLTGDAVPARKTADASLRGGISEVERPNLVFAGTSVVSGTGKAVVYATSMLTQFGRIAHLTQIVQEEATPIQVELNHLTRRISFAALGIGIFVWLVGFFQVGVATNHIEAFVLGLGIIVAVIPEGLPATLTLALAMAGQRLAQKGVLVKKLSVLETMGTISVICTDKSGTLTQNQMTVREVWVSGHSLQVSGVGYDPTGAILPDSAGQSFEPDLRAMLTVAMLCNNSRLTPPSPGHPQWTSLGDQTEAAMRVTALKGGLSEQKLNHDMPRIHELPFDARRKRMTTIHQARFWAANQAAIDNPTRPLPGRVACVKGAPREVLQLCANILINGQVVPLDESTRRAIVAANDEYARKTLRVLALARRELPEQIRSYSVESVERGLTFLGLMAMHDPPRPEVQAAIQIILKAGIRMFMITGDYGLTALSMAQRVGMLQSPEAIIVTGAELDEMDNMAVQKLLNDEVLFARMAPEHKLRLVAALQARGEVVAVTGDGVNDAPALRKADVGISMGIVGTDVAKEAADVILTNDNFATVVDAIREGRALYDNLRKFITYIFSSNVPEIMPFILTALTQIPLALRVPQILAIDLGSDILPALGLASEKPEPNVMDFPPRRRNQPIVDNPLLRRAFLWLGMIEAILCFSGFILVYYLAGHIRFLSESLAFIPTPSIPALAGLQAYLAHQNDLQIYWLAVTVYYAGVIIAQAGNAFACRAEVNRSRYLGWFSNRLLLGGVGVEIALVIIQIYTPIRDLLNLSYLPLIFWIWLGPYSLIIYSLDWLRKAFLRRIQSEKQIQETGQLQESD